MGDLIRAKQFVKDRQRLRAASATEAGTYDQSAWGMLYAAMVNAYGVDPSAFQLVYPYIAWDWAEESLGYIGADAYDVLSTIPDFSAVGKYMSTGARFHDQYAAFLGVVNPDTTDPALKKKIEDLWNDVVEATNAYDRTLQQAKDAYTADTSAGKPSFTAWLGSLDGKAWQTKLTALDQTMAQAQANYSSAVQEAHTPNLDEALETYNNRDLWSKLNDPTLAKMLPVPGYSTSTSANDWASRAANGDIAGGVIGISNSDSSYDYSHSWAGGSAKVDQVFWSVEVNGSWERITEFETDSTLNASVQFKAIQLVEVTSGPWYTGVQKLAKGPYKRGYSEYGEVSGTQAVFGEKGFLPLQKTGMYVAYQPGFSISVNQATFSAMRERFTAATALRVGPFTFEAEGGTESSGWEADSKGLSFTGTSTSTVPFICGFTVQVLP